MKKTTLVSGQRLKAMISAMLWLTVACEDGSTAAPNPQPQQVPTVAATTKPQTSPSPATELAALDQRVPVPLQPMMAWHQKQNMMGHLVAIQQITAALTKEDWGAIAAASKNIGSSPQMQQMCQHMGAGAEGFTEAALEFHRRADTIGEAAHDQDAAAVLKATATTLQACTSCHAVFRQDVVDAASWRKRTGQSHAPPGQHGMH